MLFTILIVYNYNLQLYSTCVTTNIVLYAGIRELFDSIAVLADIGLGIAMWWAGHPGIVPSFVKDRKRKLSKISLYQIR